MEVPRSLRFFVQDFYAWYVPRFWKSSPKPSVGIALKRRGPLFSPELAQALDEYSAFSGKSRLASADYQYDPFLNAGDACERYRVGAIAVEGKYYEVDVYAICSGMMRATPVVTAELMRDGDHWVFVNFRYPYERDLLAQVEMSRADMAPTSGR
jgi:hypothetical protein